MEKVKVGIIGCGNISSIYLSNLTKLFEITEVTACADLDINRAVAKANEFCIQKACSVDEILSDESIKIIVNLTIPKAHADVSLAALNAGKSVYVEKPLAVSREDGKKVLALAKEKGLLVSCAPDTFLGGGIQTCRKIIDDGLIGVPVAATAFMLCHGHESWHPDPEFYYQVGGGPMFDMGPYYLTALISLLGPVRRVCGSTNISFKERTITSQPKNGKIINVEVPTHVTGVIDFYNGAMATLITSFDVWSHTLPCIEIYGSEGSLKVPDPNGFSGPVLYRSKTDSEWRETPLTHGYTDNLRGIGAADMAYALLSGREHRANGEMGYHVLDIMHGFHDSSREDKHIILESTCKRPSPLPVGLDNGKLDL